MKGIHKEVVESSPGKPLTLCVVGFKMGDMSKNRQYSTCNKLSHLYGFNCPILTALMLLLTQAPNQS